MTTTSTHLPQGTRVKVTGASTASRYFVLGYEGDKVRLVATSANSTICFIGEDNIKTTPATAIEADPKGKAKLISAWTRYEAKRAEART